MYYTTVPVILDRAPAHQSIEESIGRGLALLNAEAGQAVILVNVIPVVLPGIFGGKVFLTVMAKPYEALISNEDKA